MADGDVSDEDRLKESEAAEEMLTSLVESKRRFKLPKIELLKFSEKIVDWLRWWAQFEKIHNADKFQYLLQSMVPITKGDDIVKGFPATAVNYSKAIKVLQERFGKRKLLMLYVVNCCMYQRIVSNGLDVASIYDKLVCHIRSLESLKITAEQASIFLYPMVKSSLPEDIMVAWQRSPIYEKDGSQEKPPKSELDYLLEFLRQEVEREEQRVLARSGFSSNMKTCKEKILGVVLALTRKNHPSQQQLGYMLEK